LHYPFPRVGNGRLDRRLNKNMTRIKIPRKFIPYLIALCVIFCVYKLHILSDAISSGTIAAEKRYHQALIFRDEDPSRYYQALAVTSVLVIAPAWLVFLLGRQWLSRR
jgi:hypothetical protein